jgi:hypothetical protein
MRLNRSVVLSAPFALVEAQLSRPALMQAVARPLVDIRSREPGGYPDHWAGGPHRASLWLFGLLPLGPQVINASRLPAPPGEARLRDNGHGPLIRRWDHHITLTDLGHGHTRYTDALEIGAGPLTPFVWAAAQLLFLWRQRQLVRIAAGGFSALDEAR